MDIATRNRTIKKVLTQAFPGKKITVRGSRGSAYGWVSVKIDHTPVNRESRDALTVAIWKLFDINGIKIDTYGYDDPGSDYGYGKKIHLEMNTDLETAADWSRRGY